MRAYLPNLPVVTFVALVLLGSGRMLHADVVAEFNQLQVRYNEQIGAGRFSEAQQTATQLRQVADGPLSSVPMAMTVAVTAQARALHAQGHFAEAEPLYQWLLDSTRQAQGGQHVETAARMEGLAVLYNDQGRFDKARSQAEPALAIRVQALGEDHAEVAQNLNTLAIAYLGQGKNADAERLWRRALAIRQKLHGLEHPETARALDNLAAACEVQDHFAEAERLKRQALTIRRRILPSEHPDMAVNLNGLAVVCFRLGRYSEAESLYTEALSIREKVLGAEHAEVAIVVNNLATLYEVQGRFSEVEPLLKRVLAIWEKSIGPGSSHVAFALNNLGHIYLTQGRYAEAEPLLQRALAIREKVSGAEHADTAACCNNLGKVYLNVARFARAEPLFRRALRIWEKSLGLEHTLVATCLSDLAVLCMEQARFAESEALLKRALAIRERTLGPEHSDVATTINNLALLYLTVGRQSEAEPLLRRAQAVWEKSLGPEHPQVARALSNLGSIEMAQGRLAEALALHTRALGICEKAFGGDHPDVASSLLNLAQVYCKQGDCAKAGPLIDRALSIARRAKLGPGSQYRCHLLRALIAWKAGSRDEALADLRQAMELAERQRLQTSGAEVERALAFGSYSEAFESMVAWQVELGNVGEALSAIERSRARSLLDEFAVGGADLDAGRPAPERQELRQREEELKGRINGLQKQLERIEADAGATHDEITRKSQELQGEMADVRGKLYEHYRDARSSNPIYRQLLSAGGSLPSLDQLRKRLLGENDLLLVYLLGDQGGYVLVVTSRREQLAVLKVDESAASTLHVDAGPLTAARLEGALMNARGTGVMQQLRQSKEAGNATDKLAALWQVLIPQAQRDALAAGRIKRLIVVPDASLALLPFETLVVKRGDPPQYLLDFGPAIQYGPSATVLYNLVKRDATPGAADREPVLTVGNPDYSSQGEQVAAKPADVLSQFAARSRYGALGGRLTPLPYSGWESSWVADAFDKAGIKAVHLEGAQATKTKVRAEMEGRRIVHLACHGLTDQSYGNFYGALALALDPTQDSAGDDGFLTLSEIYGLNLRAAELTILSACETNYGPQQRGEGVWTLSRGFLVAGSRRVVASNWLVDDEAAATLMNYFCGAIAQGQKHGSAVDYAEALHKAKRWIRQQDKWQSPYFWGTFVLVGGN